MAASLKLQKSNSLVRESEVNLTSWMNLKTLMMLARWELEAYLTTLKRWRLNRLPVPTPLCNSQISKISGYTLQILTTTTRWSPAVSKIKVVKRHSTRSCKTWRPALVFFSTTWTLETARSVLQNSMRHNTQLRIRQLDLLIMICFSNLWLLPSKPRKEFSRLRMKTP